VPYLASCFRLFSHYWLILIWASASTLATTGQEVTVHRNPSADFHSFSTYAWKQEEVARYPAVHNAIIEGVDEQMTRKGLHKVDLQDSPDLIIRYTGERTVQTVQRSTSTNNLWRENGGTATVAPQKIASGELQLIVIQPSIDQPVWTAQGRHSLTEIDDKKNRKIIRALVAKMFDKFPSVKGK
jgi:hypothetical protein